MPSIMAQSFIGGYFGMSMCAYKPIGRWRPFISISGMDIAGHLGCIFCDVPEPLVSQQTGCSQMAVRVEYM